MYTLFFLLNLRYLSYYFYGTTFTPPCRLHLQKNSSASQTQEKHWREPGWSWRDWSGEFPSCHSGAANLRYKTTCCFGHRRGTWNQSSKSLVHHIITVCVCTVVVFSLENGHHSCQIILSLLEVSFGERDQKVNLLARCVLSECFLSSLREGQLLYRHCDLKPTSVQRWPAYEEHVWFPIPRAILSALLHLYIQTVCT